MSRSNITGNSAVGGSSEYLERMDEMHQRMMEQQFETNMRSAEMNAESNTLKKISQAVETSAQNTK
ncbi:MAG: hypothetical protein HWE34_17650 [Methylocystaceae bacterium]|nr:hypothetical protein [Methylocystaceae bacterium]